MPPIRAKSPETSPLGRLELIVDEAGCGFKMGLIGGSAFHFLRGLRRSPTGARLAGARQAVRLNAPRVASKFAAWRALSSAFEGALQFAAPKDDTWNYIASSAGAIGVLSLRRGLGPAARLAALSGALFTLPEVACIILYKYEANLKDQRASNDS